MRYHQCLLTRDGLKQTAWIEERGAKQGATVEVKFDKSLWHVEHVYHPGVEAADLHKKQERDRGCFASIKVA